jgi:glutamine synthetase
MAKPIESEPGSAMHIHQSVESISTGGNLFATKRGKDSRLFLAHIAGLQKYLPEAMPLLAPNVNSYRRLIRHLAAPINVHWGRENRTVGLRVPESTAALAIAASLACGYLGMKANLEPTEPVKGSAYRYAYTLPRYLPDALARLKSSKDLREILGGDFVDLLLDVKQAEHDAYQQVISAWEREHLLLNV